MSDEAVPNRRRGVSEERQEPEPLGPSFELVDHAPFPYLILSPTGHILHANRAAVLLLGDHVSAIRGLPLIGLVPKREAAVFTQWLWQSRHEPSTVVLTLVPHGEEVDVRMMSDLARVENRVLILVAIEDLRELRRAEHRLGSLRNQLEWRVRERNHELAQANEQLK